MLYLSSVTKREQDQDHTYDFITANSLATGVYNRSVNNVPSRNSNTMIAANPAYNEESLFTNEDKHDEDEEYENMDPQPIIANGDAEYENVDAQPGQINTDDITVERNPAYAETNFT